MTLEQANKILMDKDNRADMRPIELALLTLILDIQTKFVDQKLYPKSSL